LYCDPLENKKRISTIKFLNIVLEILLKWFAPVLSFTTEEIYSLLKIDEKGSIHAERLKDFFFSKFSQTHTADILGDQ